MLYSAAQQGNSFTALQKQMRWLNVFALQQGTVSCLHTATPQSHASKLPIIVSGSAQGLSAAYVPKIQLQHDQQHVVNQQQICTKA